MNITPDQIAEAFDYYNSSLDHGHNPKSNLSICLWGAPEIVEGMVNGDIAIASVPDFVAVQIVNTFKHAIPGKPVPFEAAPHPADVNGSKTFFGGRRIAISANTKHPDSRGAGPVPHDAGSDSSPSTTPTMSSRSVRCMNYNRLPAEIAPGFTAQIADRAELGRLQERPCGDPLHVERCRAGGRLGLHRREDLEAGRGRASRGDREGTREKPEVAFQCVERPGVSASGRNYRHIRLLGR